MRHESTVSFSCSGTRFPTPPSRAICLHQAEGQPSRRGASCAVKPVHLATIPKRGQGDTRACMLPSSCDPRPRRLRRSVLDSSVALDADHPPRTPEKSVYATPSAGETLCTGCLGSPRYLLVSNKRVAIACRSQLRCEATLLRSGLAEASLNARTGILPFWWVRF